MTQQDIKNIFRQKLAKHEFKYDKRTNQKFIEIVDAHFIASSEYIVYHNHINPPTLQWYVDNYDPILSNQVDFVVDNIVEDPDTRQAYIMMLTPYTYKDDSKICTIGMHAIYQKDKKKVDYIVHMRSNNVCQYTQDYKWQLGVWLDIVNKLSDKLGEKIEFGTMYWNVDSLHIYEEDFKYLSDDTDIAKGLMTLEKIFDKTI